MSNRGLDSLDSAGQGPLPENALGAPQPCPRCGADGVIDFIDLIRGPAELHCPKCPTGWAVASEATIAYLVD